MEIIFEWVRVSVCFAHHDINYWNAHQAKQIPVNTKLKRVRGILFVSIRVCVLAHWAGHCNGALARTLKRDKHKRSACRMLHHVYAENINKTIFWITDGRPMKRERKSRRDSKQSRQISHPIKKHQRLNDGNLISSLSTNSGNDIVIYYRNLPWLWRAGFL